MDTIQLGLLGSNGSQTIQEHSYMITDFNNHSSNSNNLYSHSTFPSNEVINDQGASMKNSTYIFYNNDTNQNGFIQVEDAENKMNFYKDCTDDIGSNLMVRDGSESDGGDLKMAEGEQKEGKPITYCAVCGEQATGRYFGAMVCVPCKTFFLRYAGDGQLFQCKGNQDCQITTTTRTICKHCRFRKCLSVGMVRKVRPAQIQLHEGQQQCVVCADVANGIHFGAITCEGCKKFFRRGLTEHMTYSCKAGQQCLINPRTRNTCRYCRYQKCLASGMSREAIQMGRPSKVNLDSFISQSKTSSSETFFSSMLTTQMLQGMNPSTTFILQPNMQLLSSTSNNEFSHDASSDGSLTETGTPYTPIDTNSILDSAYLSGNKRRYNEIALEFVDAPMQQQRQPQQIFIVPDELQKQLLQQQMDQHHLQPQIDPQKKLLLHQQLELLQHDSDQNTMQKMIMQQQIDQQKHLIQQQIRQQNLVDQQNKQLLIVDQQLQMRQQAQQNILELQNKNLLDHQIKQQNLTDQQNKKLLIVDQQQQQILSQDFMLLLQQQNPEEFHHQLILQQQLIQKHMQMQQDTNKQFHRIQNVVAKSNENKTIVIEPNSFIYSPNKIDKNLVETKQNFNYNSDLNLNLSGSGLEELRNRLLAANPMDLLNLLRNAKTETSLNTNDVSLNVINDMQAPVLTQNFNSLPLTSISTSIPASIHNPNLTEIEASIVTALAEKLRNSGSHLDSNYLPLNDININAYQTNHPPNDSYVLLVDTLKSGINHSIANDSSNDIARLLMRDAESMVNHANENIDLQRTDELLADAKDFLLKEASTHEAKVKQRQQQQRHWVELMLRHGMVADNLLSLFESHSPELIIPIGSSDCDSSEDEAVGPQDDLTKAEAHFEVDDGYFEDGTPIRLLVERSMEYWRLQCLPGADIILQPIHQLILAAIVKPYKNFVNESNECNLTLNTRFKNFLNLHPEATTSDISDFVETEVVPVFTMLSLKYMKSLPGFNQFDATDQRTLLRLGQSPSRILVATKYWYSGRKKKFRQFLPWRQMTKNDQFMERMLAFARKINKVQLDEIEECFLNVAIIIATDYPGLINEAKIIETRDKIIEAFRAYTTLRWDRGSRNTRLEYIMAYAPELRQLGLLHHLCTKQAHILDNNFLAPTLPSMLSPQKNEQQFSPCKMELGSSGSPSSIDTKSDNNLVIASSSNPSPISR